MHWIFLAFYGLLISVPVYAQFQNQDTDTLAMWAAWATALVGLIGTGVAGYAAYLLRKTLVETRAATGVLQMQAQSNRAYLICSPVGDGKIEDPITLEIGDTEMVDFYAPIVWRNFGQSPALNVRLIVLPQYYSADKVTPESVLQDLRGLPSQTIPQGSNAKLENQLVQVYVARIDDAPKRRIESNYFTAFALYDDIHGREFLVRVVYEIKWDRSFYEDNPVQSGSIFTSGLSNQEIRLR